MEAPSPVEVDALKTTGSNDVDDKASLEGANQASFEVVMRLSQGCSKTISEILFETANKAVANNGWLNPQVPKRLRQVVE